MQHLCVCVNCSEKSMTLSDWRRKPSLQGRSTYVNLDQVVLSWQYSIETCFRSRNTTNYPVSDHVTSNVRMFLCKLGLYLQLTQIIFFVNSSHKMLHQYLFSYLVSQQTSVAYIFLLTVHIMLNFKFIKFEENLMQKKQIDVKVTHNRFGLTTEL